MYTKLTPRVEKVIKLAQAIAREYDLDYVGTEHILLAIRREGTGVGSQVLDDQGISEARLKEEIDRLTRKSLEDTWVFGRLPGTPHFRNVIATAIEQAEMMHSKEVGTEHLLLALLKEDGCVANKALKAFNCDFNGIHASILKRTSSKAE
jgi:ATP-dependent Clp protease ATP-binding subunit ClpC